MKTGMLVLCLLLSSLMQAQMDNEIVYPSQVKQFYSLYQQKTAWLHNANALRQLWQYLDSAANLGLQQNDYHFTFITRFRSGQVSLHSSEDSTMADYRFTDAAIHFLRDVLVGNSSAHVSYNGMNYSPDWSAVPVLLASALTSGQFSNLLQTVEPRSAEYLALKSKIVQYNKILNDTGYRKEPAITSRKLTGSNKPLVQKLYQLGIIDSTGNRYSDSSLRLVTRMAQSLFYLPADGILSTLLIKELNVPLPERVASLNRAINTVRWLHGARQSNDHILVVNIPSANLLVFNPKGISMESKIIVGQKTHRTPTLCSKVEDVVLYPYWMVPKKIATRELLPLIKRNPGYLDANGYQVVNASGKLVNPYKVRWDSLSTNYFPYVLRQSTGCDNSLGIIKLNFYNPYTVYLHDTPWKSLFKFNRRYFSHGCMRVEKAVELAKLVVKEKVAFIDSVINKGCLPDQDPIVIQARVKTPVFVLYNTAWIDASATVRFYEDVYGKFPAKRQ